ncbi:MAG: hypothetical protein ACOYWZ_04635, partial [Bacillota bacterium]
MRRKVLRLVFMMAVTTFCLSACSGNNVGTGELSYPSLKPTIAISPIPSLQPQNDMTKQFMEDAKLPIEVYEKFATAIQGDMKAREWLEKYDKENKNMYFSTLNGVFPYRNGQNAYLENECYYNIGRLYYVSNENISFKQNKEKAFYWLNLSADKGSFIGAIEAGDMARSGDGIFKNEKVAFDLYKKALENKIHGTAYERLAYCYENGIGTDKDQQKAQEYYFKSTLDGNPTGLYKLSTSAGISESKSILFLKAASSMDYDAGYFGMAYGGTDGYSANDSKLKTIEQLNEAWDNGTDPVAAQLKKSIRKGQHFPNKFIESLVKTSYTYSYHAFAKKHGIKTNRSVEDGKNIKFDFSEVKDEWDKYYESMAKKYLEYDEC